MYYQGYGVQQDYGKAVQCYEKAVEKEHAAAQYDLGVCYYYGHGVAQNKDKAIKLWKLSAEQDFEDAVKALKDMKR
jgi:TPR repeat protein